MRSTRAITLVIAAVATAVLGGLFGIYQVNHGHSLPVANINAVFTMPAVALVLALLALPVYRYRKAILKFAKPNGGGTRASHRPHPLNPFYAVRVLLLAKSTSVAAAALGGWHAGLVVLQLSTPIITSGIWNNVFALAGCVAAMAVALAVEQICKLPDNPDQPNTAEPATGTGAA